MQSQSVLSVKALMNETKNHKIMKRILLICACFLFGTGVVAAQSADSVSAPTVSAVSVVSVQTSIDSLGEAISGRLDAQQQQLDNLAEQAREAGRYHWDAIPGNQLARVINSLIPAIVFAAIVLAIYLFMNFWYHNKLAKYRVQMNLDPGQGMPDTVQFFKRIPKQMQVFGDPIGRLYRNMMTACFVLFVVFLMISLGGRSMSTWGHEVQLLFCVVATILFLIAGCVFMGLYIRRCDQQKKAETGYGNDDNRQ